MFVEEYNFFFCVEFCCLLGLVLKGVELLCLGFESLVRLFFLYWSCYIENILERYIF